MSVDVVIVNYNTRDLLRECLESVERARDEAPDLHCAVVDNASADDSAEMVRADFPWVRLVELDENVGFGAGNNRGVETGASEHLLFLNSDAQLTPGALPRLMALLDEEPGCAAAGPRLEYPDGSFQASCRRFPTVARCLWSVAGMPARTGPKRFFGMRLWLSEEEHVPGMHIDMVSGACFLMRRSVFEDIGGFDENLFLYDEEFDLFYPVSKRGWAVRYCPEAVVIHGSGKSVEANETGSFARFHLYRSKYYAFRKHYGAHAAWLTYWGDLAVFGATGAVQRIRRGASEALKNFRICRLAWPAARLAGADVRRRPPELP